jgi:hypothetical protein
VRRHGTSTTQGNFYREQVTPYPCIVHSLFGDVPSICDDSDCKYAADQPANGVEISVDLQVPIDPPEP